MAVAVGDDDGSASGGVRDGVGSAVGDGDAPTDRDDVADGADDDGDAQGAVGGPALFLQQARKPRRGVRKDFDQLFIANANVGGGGCSHSL